MSDDSRRSANALLYDATKPSYQQWIALPGKAQQEGLKALHARRVALEAQRATISRDENLAEYRLDGRGMRRRLLQLAAL